MNIIIFGDSIAWGAWDREGGWAGRLGRWANEISIRSEFAKEIYVYNLGIPGDSTRTLLERAKDELDRRTDDDLILIFAIGANDTTFDPKDDNRIPAVSPEEFRANMEKLIAQGRYYNAKSIIFIGLTPCNEDKTIPVSWDKHIAYSNFWLNEYREVMEDVVQENNVSYIAMWDVFAEGDWRSMLPDGIHPNAQAHEKMFQEVKKFLEDKKLLE